ncbi:hypothetical protein O6H91_06G044100 [Diphasiastrum complanatum]|uniref:Uncharacterized protein n=2 Tax=Diphasiastrum complanatum TaxID=34168 RepID=A0ACC2DCT6_DIPCM|nr:hypothetical protein O6H91_06G044100 [Diphasiastrum complanatum]
MEVKDFAIWLPCLICFVSILPAPFLGDEIFDYQHMCSADGTEWEGLGCGTTKLLIKGGTVVNADLQFIRDVYVEDGIIQMVAQNLPVTDDVRVIDATGKFVMPGINSFKFFLAYKGALMVTDEQMLQGFKKCKELGALPLVHAENGDAVAEGQSQIFAMGITGPEGHALSRPPVLEGEATARSIRLAKFINTPLYVVHVMSIDAMQEISQARQSGQRVIGEPIVSSLALDDSKLWDADFKIAAQYVMSPPIRSAGHDKALQAALSTGILQLVGTDHAPFNSSQKAQGRHDFRAIPNGVNGIEERMHIVWDVMVNSGKLSPREYVRITSTACAQIFNIYPRKGAILPGSDADIIILNPNATTKISASTHHSRMDTNIYEGWTMKGNIEVTISQGRVAWENGRLHVKRGAGRYIPMAPFSYLFDGLDKLDLEYVSSFKAPVDRSTAA